MDVGHQFGGIGSSRVVMIAALAEPAMLLNLLLHGAGRRLDPVVDGGNFMALILRRITGVRWEWRSSR